MNRLKLYTLSILIPIFLLTSLIGISQTPLKMRDTTVKGPQTFAMIVGISKYKYVRPLTYADKDAELFRDYLKSPGGGSVKAENIFCLLNDQAINQTFWGKGFQWLKAKKLQRGDKLFIYLAGHGDAIDEDQFFFLGYDCNPQGDKNNYLVSGAIQLFNLKKKISDETAKGVEVIFIMDACRSDELPGGTEGQSFLNTAITEKRAGEIIMLATGAGQESLEDVSIGNGHGLFTWYLVDGLNGLADSLDTPDQKVSFREIQTYVGKYVPSIALQRFKKKQDPYFCCTENSERVISSVDTNYLKNWLRTKRARGPGNSFNPYAGITIDVAPADTMLLQTYDRFYSAVRRNNLSGQSSAEDYYQQLNKKYPGNPYTLDAQSTLAVEFVNVAQKLVDEYLGCSESTPRQKQQMGEAAVGLEKAIALFREEGNTDFANSLLGRLYLLKASSSPTTAVSLPYAYTGLSINPDGAYIMNKLALLHLENNRTDSALYYANKATNTAPKWACALTTLALVKKATEQPNQNNDKQKAKKSIRGNSFGGVLGGGISQLNPTFGGSRNSNIIGINARDIIKADLGIIYQIGIGRNTSIRPSTVVSMEGGELIYDRRNATGGPIFRDTVKLKNTSVSISLPIIIHLSDNKIAPFISLGPSFNYIISQDATSTERVPVKKSVILGDAGVGVDIAIGKSSLMLSPELKYTQGISNQREDASNDFTNTLSSLKKRGITLSIYLRRR